MKRDSVGQKARKMSGHRTEHLVKKILEEDQKVSEHFHVRMSSSRGKVPGLDAKLVPKIKECSVNPDSPACRPVEMEVKSVEKLFENDEKVDWPHNRVSRYVLKKSEDPACYVFVTNDNLSDHIVVDFVDSTRIRQWMNRFRAGVKTPKLPVRALPLLRKYPCRYTSRSTVVIPANREKR